jgi:hypothetical protein
MPGESRFAQLRATTRFQAGRLPFGTSIRPPPYSPGRCAELEGPYRVTTRRPEPRRGLRRVGTLIVDVGLLHDAFGPLDLRAAASRPLVEVRTAPGYPAGAARRYARHVGARSARQPDGSWAFAGIDNTTARRMVRVVRAGRQRGPTRRPRSRARTLRVRARSGSRGDPPDDPDDEPTGVELAPGVAGRRSVDQPDGRTHCPRGHTYTQEAE